MFNKAFKQMLKKMAAEDPTNWDRYLQPLLFAYREVPQKSTGFSAFEHIFGYEVRGPLFLITERFLNLDSQYDDMPVTEYVMEIREKLPQFMEMAGKLEADAKVRHKVYYDKRARNRSFKIGDVVTV